MEESSDSSQWWKKRFQILYLYLVSKQTIIAAMNDNYSHFTGEMASACQSFDHNQFHGNMHVDLLE